MWDAFWTGGLSNPLEVIEQITYLLFIRRLDEIQTLEEAKAADIPGHKMRRIFPEGDYRPAGSAKETVLGESLRWSRLKNFDPARMYSLIAEYVFPWLRELG